MTGALESMPKIPNDFGPLYAAFLDLHRTRGRRLILGLDQVIERKAPIDFKEMQSYLALIGASPEFSQFVARIVQMADAEYLAHASRKKPEG